jgi:Flp pilus assembly protein TadD
MSDAYEFFQKGSRLLEDGHFNAATISLAKARDLEPDKTSIREALGRAYFRSHQFERAREEFEAVVERAPTNDYALFCLGRSLMQLGLPGEARRPLAQAASLRPDRRDYRIYRDRARAAAA